MQRITHPTAAPGGRFTDGDPGSSTAATVVEASFLNAVQDELIEAIEEAGLTPSAGDVSQVTQAIKILATGNGGLKNVAINGDFAVWQRGTTFTGIALVERYTADRWAVVADGTGGAGVATVSRQAFAVGQTDVKGARHHLRFQQTTPSTAGGGRIRTKLEALEHLANGDVTVSLWLKASSAITVTANLVNVYGSASSSTVGSATLAVTTSWQRFAFTRTLPSVAGQSVDQNLAHIMLELALPAGSPLLDVARVQLERSSIASPFEVRPLALERVLCRRYFEKSYEHDTAPATASVLPGAHVAVTPTLVSELAPLQARFAVSKRAAPSIAWYSPATGLIGKLLQFTGNVDVTVSGTQHITRETTGWPIVQSAFTEQRLVLVHWTADAEL